MTERWREDMKKEKEWRDGDSDRHATTRSILKIEEVEREECEGKEER